MKFYDPGFALACAIFSLSLWPIWALMFGSPEAGTWFTAIFAAGVLIFMLRQSWNMAHDS